jgi:hypothetical protein
VVPKISQSGIAILKMGPTTWYRKLQSVKYSHLKTGPTASHHITSLLSHQHRYPAVYRWFNVLKFCSTLQCPPIIHSNRCKQEDSSASGGRPSPQSLASGSPSSAHGPPTPPTTPNGGGDKRTATASVQHHLSPSGKWRHSSSISRVIILIDNPEDWNSKLPRNVGNCSPVYTASYPMSDYVSQATVSVVRLRFSGYGFSCQITFLKLRFQLSDYVSQATVSVVRLRFSSYGLG